jgi:hypothetical protein
MPASTLSALKAITWQLAGIGSDRASFHRVDPGRSAHECFPWVVRQVRRLRVLGLSAGAADRSLRWKDDNEYERGLELGLSPNCPS